MGTCVGSRGLQVGGLAIGHAAFNLRMPPPDRPDPCCAEAAEPTPAPPNRLGGLDGGSSQGAAAGGAGGPNGSYVAPLLSVNACSGGRPASGMRGTPSEAAGADAAGAGGGEGR